MKSLLLGLGSRTPTFAAASGARFGSFINIEALSAAPPEAYSQNSSQMPQSCPVAPQILHVLVLLPIVDLVASKGRKPWYRPQFK